jgi:predicted membrane GTPase involved in stress response
VQARGEMQLAVVIEGLRREGIEMAVSPPQARLICAPQLRGHSCTCTAAMVAATQHCARILLAVAAAAAAAAASGTVQAG